ncbi:resolvase [Photobacterium kishitanii]|uniref:Resolvase n=1 Tax=Photobacterium kishitanii TaxID=318456 RepID=A0AAX0YT88_9GAMM|nr:recombinase family protein [Photobacterium kishitanii]KJG55371.1 resolvase [Photobacterium kishitanii]KJG57976.1 resolvase [Photobacterium kishitanii]KJG63663.1 resolvase [Photobacterium kishitanii]KJG66386.1 resolvase [Photobacterium kishitanii]PSX16860.1 resolvase [Photobacterium kishitanii]
MASYAYLRISTDAQDVNNQKHGILEYANRMGLVNLAFVEDAVSGTKKWRQRRLGLMLEDMVSGDVLIFAEVTRMARSTIQVLEILEYCMDKEITVHITKQNMVLDGSMQSKIIATILGLAGEIEREFIRQRTKEALAARVAKGITLGRPKGKATRLKLDDKRDDIEKYYKMGLSLREIAKLLTIPSSTLNDYIKIREITR